MTWSKRRLQMRSMREHKSPDAKWAKMAEQTSVGKGMESFEQNGGIKFQQWGKETGRVQEFRRWTGRQRHFMGRQRHFIIITESALQWCIQAQLPEGPKDESRPMRRLASRPVHRPM